MAASSFRASRTLAASSSRSMSASSSASSSPRRLPRLTRKMKRVRTVAPAMAMPAHAPMVRPPTCPLLLSEFPPPAGFSMGGTTSDETDGTDDDDTDGAALSVGHVELLGLSLGPALTLGESLGPALTLGIALTVGEPLGTALTVGGALTVGSTVVGNSPVGGILYSSGMASAVVSHTSATYCCICSDIVAGSSMPVMLILARLPWQQLSRPPNWVHWHVSVTYANLLFMGRSE
mmetsp:Transcript_38217/g.92182  ORF Transcript_38217/g.92182 Transcript_38217/m.92182 type:complete len:234 (-) Transcript_38217:228-929(-)